MKWFIKERIKDAEYFRDRMVHALSRKYRERPLVKEVYDGLVTPDYTRPTCLFCGYDSQSVIRAYVYHYLHTLVDAGGNQAAAGCAY